MNESFKAAVAFYKPIPKITHKQEVQRLYRSSLRCLFSWTESWELFNDEALKIRDEFRENMNLPPGSAKTARLVREAHERLFAQTHPDPYIKNYMPGGSLFMRNAAPPLELMFPDGIPEGMSRRRLNIDMSNIPDDQEYADKVFVEGKTYYIDR